MRREGTGSELPAELLKCARVEPCPVMGTKTCYLSIRLINQRIAPTVVVAPPTPGSLGRGGFIPVLSTAAPQWLVVWILELSGAACDPHPHPLGQHHYK